jgi:farnesyl diphosphate synthase
LSAFHQALRASVQAVNQELEALLPEPAGLQARVLEAMRYCTLAGGKRLRPFLVITGAQLFDVPRRSALAAAAAVELVHTYSLVHDDLPCMDDDDLRRGMPTLHVKFDEATAVLAGDALLTLAFEVLASERTHADPAVRCELVAKLAGAAGGDGMVGGQMMDLLAENRELDEAGIKLLQQMKTGALFTFSCEAGAILGQAPEAAREALRAYAGALGLAFQIADDLLDAEGARAEAERLASEAKQHLDIFAEDADLLRQVADFVIRRRA